MSKIKKCDYCEITGIMPTFADGETICTKCLTSLPISSREGRRAIMKLKADFERECADIDRLLQNGMGWTSDRTRTEGGSLKVEELAEAMRSMLAPGSGG